MRGGIMEKASHLLGIRKECWRGKGSLEDLVQESDDIPSLLLENPTVAVHMKSITRRNSRYKYLFMLHDRKVQFYADPRLTEHAKPVQILYPASSKSWERVIDLNDEDEGL